VLLKDIHFIESIDEISIIKGGISAVVNEYVSTNPASASVDAKAEGPITHAIGDIKVKSIANRHYSYESAYAVGYALSYDPYTREIARDMGRSYIKN
jgi:hypothetical protein